MPSFMSVILKRYLWFLTSCLIKKQLFLVLYRPDIRFVIHLL